MYFSNNISEHNRNLKPIMSVMIVSIDIKGLTTWPI